mmetsp:Transcript_28427/g.71402  ORF Transcript_28427/g.71402 Transcript_28427/m.71402 type:complete len:369 (-) Transcript_28427:108-1214(-)
MSLPPELQLKILVESVHSAPASTSHDPLQQLEICCTAVPDLAHHLKTSHEVLAACFPSLTLSDQLWKDKPAWFWFLPEAYYVVFEKDCAPYNCGKERVEAADCPKDPVFSRLYPPASFEAQPTSATKFDALLALHKVRASCAWDRHKTRLQEELTNCPTSYTHPDGESGWEGSVIQSDTEQACLEVFQSLCARGHFLLVRDLLRLPFFAENVNALGLGITTALQLAAKNGYFPIVQTLVSSGAVADLLCPLGAALAHKHERTARFLLFECSAPPTDPGNIHKIPLVLAARHGFADIVRKLVEEGADVDDGPLKRGPLFEAACNNHREIAEFLLDEEADLLAFEPWTGVQETLDEVRKRWPDLVDTHMP